MARLSQGPRRATTWAATQNPRPMPRVVRLGRPANDNVRQASALVRIVVLAAAGALALLAAVWNLI